MTGKGFEHTQNLLRISNQDLDEARLNSLRAFVQRFLRRGLGNNEFDVFQEVLSLSQAHLTQLYIVKLMTFLRRNSCELEHLDEFDFFLDFLVLTHPDVKLDYFFRIRSLLEEDRLVDQLADSLSINQFRSKFPLLEAIDSRGLIDQHSTVVIWGCWFGSILIPHLMKKANRIIGIDKDDEVIRFAKNKIFPETSQVELICDDIFAKHRDFYLETSLIINTACEHMAPMKDWPWFGHGALATDLNYLQGTADNDPRKKKLFKTPKLSSNCHFAFQSNNMTGIEGHINCVESLEAFEAQLPLRAEVMYRETIADERGTRFMLLGKFV